MNNLDEILIAKEKYIEEHGYITYGKFYPIYKKQQHDEIGRKERHRKLIAELRKRGEQEQFKKTNIVVKE